ncbi:MAG: hypothetical protein N2C12_02375 [Planctomycetales bacterium]
MHPSANIGDLVVLADIGDVIATIFPIIIFVIWVIGQAVGAIRKQVQPQQPAANDPDEVPQQDLANEIDAFLRRVQNRDDRQELEIPQPQPTEVVDAELLDIEPYITSSAPEDRSQIGEKVNQSENRFDQHIHEVFDHDLGSLGKSRQQQEVTPEVPTSAEEVRKLFSDAENIRKAVILNEVFARPEGRW